MTKYLFITGGVISSVGKGIITSSLAKLMEAQGYNITAMKIDPYLNLDAGTMRPTEHGEVYVTEDGFETDQDLGNYERFTNTTTLRDNSITTGQIYLKVIKDEREGQYEGKCVEFIPHIPLEVIRRIKHVASTSNAEIVLVEVGGTAGEYQLFPFLDAMRRMRYDGEEMIHIHVGYLPIPSKVGEQKSKPLQRSVFDLLSVGVRPDFIIGRSRRPLDEERKAKIAMNCNVRKERVLSAPDVDLIYEVPLILKEQGLDKMICEKLKLEYQEATKDMAAWKVLVETIRNNTPQEVVIAIVGKYFDTGSFSLEDSYISVIESIKHAAWHNHVKPKIAWIDSKAYEKDPEKLKELSQVDGIIVPGGFGERGVEGKIRAIQYARENKIPYLGLCYGMQLAVVEFARHVCKLERAHTTEIDRDTPYPVIDILPEQKKNLADKNFGASMRLGSYAARLNKGTTVHKLYGKEVITERHRHRWECNREFLALLEKNGIVIAGKNDEKDLVEFVELPKTMHPYFVGTQAHPEFKSKFMKPAPLFMGLIQAAKERRLGVQRQNKVLSPTSLAQ